MAPHSSGLTKERPRHDVRLASPHPTADQTTTTTTTTTTSSSTVEPFPPLTKSQRLRIEQTLDRLPDGARTWADLSLAQHQQLDGGDDDDEDDGLYELWLKLVWQDGVTWRDKWDNVRRQLDQSSAPRRDVREERHQRTHRRRPSDNLDLLREKLDRISLGLKDAQPTQTRSPLPLPSQPKRPHSTPPRPLLVPAPPQQTATRLGYTTDEHAHGYLSSDDHFVGVPTPRQRRLAKLALPPRAERRAFTTTDEDDSRKPQAAPRSSRSRRATHVGGDVASAPEMMLPPPIMSTPVRPSAAHGSLTVNPNPEPDPTPLLSARLSTLHGQPLEDVLPARPPPPPLSPTPSSSLLIGATFSQPEAVSRALQFSRLRLLLPLFTHWSNRTRLILTREAELDLKRGDWLKRCAVESWRLRLGRIEEKDAVAKDFAKKRVRRLGMAKWRERVREREKRKRVDDLTSARDAVIRTRDDRLVHAAFGQWRFRAADRVVTRRRASNLARAILLAWRRRLRARASRTRALEEVAEEQWDRWELVRAKRSWAWWIRLTALRVKEEAIRTEKDEQVKALVLSRWHDRAQEADRIRRLEALATFSDSHRLATESLSHWIALLLRRRQQESQAAAHAQTILVKRAADLLSRWRLSLRLRLSTRVREQDLSASMLVRWLDAYEHVRFDLVEKADHHIAERESTLARVSLASWRDSTGRVLRLSKAAQGVYTTRITVKAFSNWRGRLAKQEVQVRKARVVRDFMLLRTCWRKWAEREWERRRAAWEESKKRERTREAWQFWVQQTQRKRLERELVVRFRRKQDRRLAAGTLDAWLGAVIAHRDRDREAAQWSQARLLRFGFSGWADATVRADQRLVLADAHRAVKLEELRERLFRQWVTNARRTRDLRQRYEAVLTYRRHAALERSWDRWRERLLRGVEKQLERRRNRRECERAWDWWKSSTKTLAAIDYHKVQLASRALACWRAWTPPRELSMQGPSTDRRAMQSGALQVWRIKAHAKFALRSVNGRMRLGHSPSSASPPLRVSTSQRHDSSPSPSFTSLSTPPRSALASTAATSHPRASPVLNSNAALADPLDQPRTSAQLARQLSGSSATSTAPRPRLSAEYAQSQLSQDRPRRRKSIISLLDARSESAAGRRASFGTTSGDEADGRRGETRSEGGGRHGRDVRSQHDALRRRLREAALKAGAT